MIRIAAIALTLALTACTPSSKEACIAEYGSKGRTEKLVRVAFSLCETAFNPSVSKLARDRAQCAVEQVPDLKTDAAFYAVRAGCDAQFPAPTCAAGETFSLVSGECERPIVDPFDP